MKRSSTFQLFFIGAFVVLCVAGVLVFSFFNKPNASSEAYVTMWGTMPGSNMSQFLNQVALQTKNKLHINYTYKSEQNFTADLLEALATSKGPDLVIVGQDELLANVNKVLPISYSVYPEKDFKTNFIPESDLMLIPKGVLGVPFVIDPMVMFWNRDLFNNANLVAPPKYWDELLKITPTLTKRDAASNITQSAIGLGEYRNITHAKDILSMFILQGGNPITVYQNGNYVSTFNSRLNAITPAAESSLTFYTQFADPLKDINTWNRGLPDSKTLFLSNKLAMYIGYGSEFREIKEKNPNLNFDVTMMPQLKPQSGAQGNVVTGGKLYSISILKSSPQQAVAYKAITLLTTQANMKAWTKLTGLPSVRRDALSYDPGYAETQVFSQAVLRTKGWLEPDPNGTELIFKNMIEGVTSGRDRTTDAVVNADNQLTNLLSNVNAKNR